MKFFFLQYTHRYIHTYIYKGLIHYDNELDAWAHLFHWCKTNHSYCTCNLFFIFFFLFCFVFLFLYVALHPLQGAVSSVCHNVDALVAMNCVLGAPSPLLFFEAPTTNCPSFSIFFSKKFCNRAQSLSLSLCNVLAADAIFFFGKPKTDLGKTPLSVFYSTIEHRGPLRFLCQRSVASMTALLTFFSKTQPKDPFYIFFSDNKQLQQVFLRSSWVRVSLS